MSTAVPVPAAAGAPETGAGEQGGYRGRHPIAAIFHVLFKGIAVLIFILSGMGIISSYILMFIIVTLMIAADFWTVKNVTGRLMVGLRWWNQIKDDGSSEWIFESAQDADRVSAVDASLFWTTTYGNVVVWAVFLFLNLTSFSRLPLCVLALALGGSNAVGYTRCRKDAKKKMSNFIMQQAARVV